MKWQTAINSRTNQLNQENKFKVNVLLRDYIPVKKKTLFWVVLALRLTLYIAVFSADQLKFL